MSNIPKNEEEFNSLSDFSNNQVIDFVNNMWVGVFGEPLNEQELQNIRNEVLVFEKTKLYSIIFGTEVKRLEKLIIQEAKTAQELLYYRAMLHDREVMFNVIQKIKNSSINKQMKNNYKY